MKWEEGMNLKNKLKYDKTKKLSITDTTRIRRLFKDKSSRCILSSDRIK